MADKQQEVIDYDKLFEEILEAKQELNQTLLEAEELLRGDDNGSQQQQQPARSQNMLGRKTRANQAFGSLQSSPTSSIMTTTSSLEALPNRTTRDFNMSRAQLSIAPGRYGGASFANVSKSLSTRYPPTRQNKLIMSTPRNPTQE